MLDSEVIDLAEAFAALGSEFHNSEVDGADQSVDILVDFYFPDGYRIDQVGATIDLVDTALTAGFYAAEAFELQTAISDVFRRDLLPDEVLSIEWEFVFALAGSLHLRATVKRVGGWASRHKASSLWVLGGLAVVLPAVGLPVLVGTGAPWLVGGAVEGLAWVHDRKSTKAKVVGEPAAPPPQVIVGAVPAVREADEAAPRGVHTRLIVLEGNRARNQRFLDRLHEVEGVEGQTRFLGSPENQEDSPSTIKVWSAAALTADSLRKWADETGALLLDVSDDLVS